MKYEPPFALYLTVDRPDIGHGQGHMRGGFQRIWHARSFRKALTNFNPEQIEVRDANGMLVPDEIPD